MQNDTVTRICSKHRHDCHYKRINLSLGEAHSEQLPAACTITNDHNTVIMIVFYDQQTGWSQVGHVAGAAWGEGWCSDLP